MSLTFKRRNVFTSQKLQLFLMNFIYCCICPVTFFYQENRMLVYIQMQRNSNVAYNCIMPRIHITHTHTCINKMSLAENFCKKLHHIFPRMLLKINQYIICVDRFNREFNNVISEYVSIFL